MVFNSAEAEPENDYKSMMAKFERRKAITPPAGSKPKPEASTSRPMNVPVRPNGNATRTEIQRPSITSQSSRPAPSNEKPNTSQAGIKRKAEGPESVPKKPAVDTAALMPQKGYYASLLKAAAQQTVAPVTAVPGAIVGKKKVAPEPFVPGKRDLKGKDASKSSLDAKAKSNSNSSSASKNVKPGTKANVLVKPEPASKITKPTKPLERKGPLPPLAATRPLPPLAAKPKATSGKARTESPPPKKLARDSYSSRERDRERDSYRERGPPKIPARRYVYREDSYDDESDSDMEAGGMDILEEEEASARRARLEDAEQERLEKQHAAEKARRKAMLGRK